MSVLIELSPLETLFMVLTGRGDQILWTQADVEEHYRRKRKLKEQQAAERRQVSKAPKESVFQTKFTDDELLRTSLRNTNTAYTEQNRKFICKIGNSDITICKTPDSNYEFRIIGDGNLTPVQDFYNKLGSEYERQLQKQICNNIREKVSKNPSMKIENEEILEDNSVVITINV